MAPVFCFLPLIRCSFPGAQVRFLRFEGESEGSGEQWNAVRDSVIEGPVPDLIQRTEQVLDEQLRTFSKLGPDSRFFPTPEYPKEARVCSPLLGHTQEHSDLRQDVRQSSRNSQPWSVPTERHTREH